MYCGCNPIAYRSQKQIAGALQSLMEQKPYETIGVSELCREAGVSRQTFYSLFSSLDNVVLFMLQEKNCCMEENDVRCDSLEQFSFYCSRYISTNRDVLRLLTRHHAGHLIYDSLYESFRACACEEDGRTAYRAHYLAGALTGIALQYCKEEPPTEEEKLERIILDLLKGELF